MKVWSQWKIFTSKSTVQKKGCCPFHTDPPSNSPDRTRAQLPVCLWARFTPALCYHEDFMTPNVLQNARGRSHSLVPCINGSQSTTPSLPSPTRNPTQKPSDSQGGSGRGLCISYYALAWCSALANAESSSQRCQSPLCFAPIILCLPSICMLFHGTLY